MKKLVLALTTASVFALTACGGDKQVEVNQPAEPAVEQQVAAPEQAAPAQEAAAAQDAAAAPATDESKK